MLSVPKSEGKRQSFDFVGFFTLAAGICAITMGLMEGNGWGWTSPLTLSLFIFGIVSIALIVFSEREIEHPLIDFKLYKNRIFLGASTSIFFNQLQLAITVFWAMYLQNALGYSPSAAGTLSLIANIPLFFMPPLAGFLVDKYGPKIPVPLGFALICIALGIFIFHPHPSLSMLLAIFTLYGCGIPMIFTPSVTSAMAQAHEAKRGMVSAMTTTLRQFSTTLGIALFTALLVTKENAVFSSLLKSHSSTKNIDPNLLEGIISKTPASLESLDSLPGPSASLAIDFAHEAYSSAFVLMNSAAALCSLLGLSFAFYLFAKTGPLHRTNK
jgi:predicted MFS family arabinose efflux permease